MLVKNNGKKLKIKEKKVKIREKLKKLKTAFTPMFKIIGISIAIITIFIGTIISTLLKNDK